MNAIREAKLTASKDSR